MSGDETPLDDGHREDLLTRVERKGAVVGSRVPETVTIGDTEVALRAFVRETTARDTVPPEQRDHVRAVLETLRGERAVRKDRLEHDRLTVAEATALADSIVGIDRAIAALTDLRPASPGTERRAERLAEDRSWVAFLRQLRE
ncbi:DUF5788 family protein [Haloglomus litoreum]|uniref:DUF5788 family protein n=1 Tax=Haloglomus litoreum TaxID=3034026 RepID=UPI0023E79E1D|nr:DUF5788 family protein [Haloglomus sp. DT116]